MDKNFITIWKHYIHLINIKLKTIMENRIYLQYKYKHQKNAICILINNCN